MPAALTLRGVSKWYGAAKVVDGLSLEIQEGEFFTLLGPSGCGKTTTLRMIAGLERPDEGDIFLKGRPIVSVERGIYVNPDKRNMGMVFQSYAIWPHMTVQKNVAYPLEVRRFDRATITEKVRKALSLVGLEKLEDRPATRLSGGQQQRVAIARALVYEPEVLLFDEPLSNLDAKLREQMRVDLKLLQQRLGITVVYVTHDQLEALSLSNQVIVLNGGKVEQQGTARKLYDHPETQFVRDFVGKTILLKGTPRSINADDVRVELTYAPGTFVRCPNRGGTTVAVGQDVYLSVRPEDVVFKEHGDRTDDNILSGTVETVLFVGERSESQIKVGDERILIYTPRNRHFEQGQAISLHLPRDTVIVWPA
jgi:iron(III) transport system ATP-binding protein